MTDWMKDLGARLRDNGYSIIPVKPGSKVPGRYSNNEWKNFTGWNQYAHKPAQPFVIQTWTRWPGCSIGVMCGMAPGQEIGLAPIDIDILDPILAGRVTEIFVRHLGETPAVRIGLAPKIMLIYATKETIGKIAKGSIEILGHGQQFVGYGIHEKTGEPYKWPMESLADIHISKLPLVTAEQLWTALDEAYDILPDEMKTGRLGAPKKLADNVVAFTGGHQANDDLQGTPEACREMLNRIPNPNLIWDDWNKIGMALWGASGGQQWGWELFDEFSRRSAKYEARETVARWRSFNKSQPHSIGFGTLQHLAMQYDATPIPADIPFNEAKRQASEFDISALLEQKLTPPPPPRPEAPPVVYLQMTKAQRDKFPREWLETSSLIGRTVQWIVSQGTVEHPTLALGNTLAMMGALFGRRYRANGVSALNTTANVFCVGIAPTASGKDHSRKLILKLMRAAGLQQFSGGDEFSSGPAIQTMMQIFPSRLCMLDEFGLFLASVRDPKAPAYRKSIMSMFLKLYSTAGSAMLGQEYANQKDNARIDIEAPNFNVYGTTTPETLVAALDRSLAADGTLSRMLWFPPFEAHPDPQILKPGRTSVIPQDLIDDLKAAMSVTPTGAGNLSFLQQPDVAPETIDVTYEAGVEDNLQAIAIRETEYKREGRAEWGRLLESTLKLAMMEAIARTPAAPVITEEVLIMGYRLAVWCFEYLESIVRDDVSENEFEKRRNQMRKYIANTGGATQTQIAKQFTGMKSKERQEILQALEEAGEIISEKHQNPNGGPPARTYKSTRAA